MSAAAYLDEWHTTIDKLVNDGVTQADRDTAKLRGDLILEEAVEAYDAIMAGNSLPHIAKELADVVYVCYGAARKYGIDLDAVLSAVHASNMTKFDGDVWIHVDGKIGKSSKYVEPDIAAVLANN